MKKCIVLTALVAILGLHLFSAPKEAHAVDFGVGMTMLYTGWSSAMEDLYNMDDVQLLMWGPTLSVSFLERWSLSFVGIQNIFNQASVSRVQQDGTGALGPYILTSESTDLGRLDCDVVLSYRINDWLGLFVGYKFYWYFINGSDMNVTAPYTKNDLDSLNMRNISHAPGFGASLRYNVIDNFFVIFNLSFVMMSSEFQMLEYGGVSGTNLLTEDVVYNYFGLGGNSNLSFMYFVEAINLSVSLGGRFQVFKYFEVDDAPALAVEYYYGMTASVIFTF